jgi:hypothetical protein
MNNNNKKKEEIKNKNHRPAKFDPVLGASNCGIGMSGG